MKALFCFISLMVAILMAPTTTVSGNEDLPMNKGSSFQSTICNQSSVVAGLILQNVKELVAVDQNMTKGLSTMQMQATLKTRFAELDSMMMMPPTMRPGVATLTTTGFAKSRPPLIDVTLSTTSSTSAVMSLLGPSVVKLWPTCDVSSLVVNNTNDAETVTAEVLSGPITVKLLPISEMTSTSNLPVS